VYTKNEAGFSAIDTVLAVVLVAAIAAVGYIGYMNLQGTTSLSANPLLPQAMKTYTDPAGIYSLKYPSNWSASSEQSSVQAVAGWPTLADPQAGAIDPPHKQGTVVGVNVFNGSDFSAYEKQVRGSLSSNGTATFTDTKVGSNPAFIERWTVNGEESESYVIGSGAYYVALQMELTAPKPFLTNNLAYLHQFTAMAQSVKVLK